MSKQLTEEHLRKEMERIERDNDIAALRARVAKLEAALQKLYDEGEYASVEFMQEVAALLKGAP